MSKFLRFFFRLLYHEFAWAYDLIAWFVSFGHWTKWVHSTIEFIDKGPVLELGFGTGRLQKSLATTNHTIYGLDKSKQMARIASKRFRQSGIGYHLIIGDGQRIPFPNQSISTILTTFPTEYLFTNATFSEVRRVLKPTGKFIILLYVEISNKKLSHRLLSWLYKITGQTPGVDSESLLKNLFQSAGYNSSVRQVQESFYTLHIIEAQPIA